MACDFRVQGLPLDCRLPRRGCVCQGRLNCSETWCSKSLSPSHPNHSPASPSGTLAAPLPFSSMESHRCVPHRMDSISPSLGNPLRCIHRAKSRHSLQRGSSTQSQARMAPTLSHCHHPPAPAPAPPPPPPHPTGRPSIPPPTVQSPQTKIYADAGRSLVRVCRGGDGGRVEMSTSGTGDANPHHGRTAFRFLLPSRALPLASSARRAHMMRAPSHLPRVGECPSSRPPRDLLPPPAFPPAQGWATAGCTRSGRRMSSPWGNRLSGPLNATQGKPLGGAGRPQGARKAAGGRSRVRRLVRRLITWSGALRRYAAPGSALPTLGRPGPVEARRSAASDLSLPRPPSPQAASARLAPASRHPGLDDESGSGRRKQKSILIFAFKVRRLSGIEMSPDSNSVVRNL